MSDWQERITHETAPAIRAEHELRYRAVAGLVAEAGCWTDLGCGNGIAAAAAFGSQLPLAVVLADLDEHSVELAAVELGRPDAHRIRADLADESDLGRIAAALRERPGARVITCFEVIEHLPSFVGLLEWATARAREDDCTFVLSVPNDAFWATENPHHLTRWGEGAFEELTRLLPAERTVLRQVGVVGSALLPWSVESAHYNVDVLVGGEEYQATHFLAAFGPGHAQLELGALAAQADALAQLHWERERENNLAVSQRMVVEQRRLLDEVESELATRDGRFAEWRAYIHELEQRLGLPLSGVVEEEHPPFAGADAAGDEHAERATEEVPTAPGASTPPGQRE